MKEFFNKIIFNSFLLNKNCSGKSTTTATITPCSVCGIGAICNIESNQKANCTCPPTQMGNPYVQCCG